MTGCPSFCRPRRLRRLSILLLILPIAATMMGQTSWTIDLPTVGTFSSPRAVDLTADGVLDIVMGAGREEFQACDTAIFALDGATGQLLWKISAKDQIFGSAVFLDVTGDGVSDVFINGRSAELTAVDGARGSVLWKFNEVNGIDRPAEQGWFNFYNVQLSHDEDQDGFADLLVSNGGDVMAEPFDPDRPAGQLVLVSSRTGELLHRAEMPDGKETYMSVTLTPAGEVIFGTGGETLGGSLFAGTLAQLINHDLGAAARLDSSEEKGFIGPSVVADLSGDQVPDIITNAVDGRLLAFDGHSKDKLWQVVLPNTESYSSAAVGYFTPDAVPDVFISFGRGVWPHLGWGIQKMVDGATGDVLFTDSLGFYQNTSPLAIDLTADGRDEVLMSVNFQEVDELYRKFFYTMLAIIDFSSGEIIKISDVHEGSNLSSTPWVGDLDDDGFLDIIYCHGTNLRHTYTFDGLQVHRLVTQIPMPPHLSWGAYQGHHYDGVFRSRQRNP